MSRAQLSPAQDTGRATLGVVARLIAVIAATFLFAAFSGRSPAHSQAQTQSHDQAVVPKQGTAADPQKAQE